MSDGRRTADKVRYEYYTHGGRIYEWFIYRGWQTKSDSNITWSENSNQDQTWKLDMDVRFTEDGRWVSNVTFTQNDKQGQTQKLHDRKMADKVRYGCYMDQG